MRERLVYVAGAIAIAALLAFPPWVAEVEGHHVRMGHHARWAHAQRYEFSLGRATPARIDSALLIAEILAAAAIAALTGKAIR